MYYIVTDSSTDMPQSWVEAQHDFHIVSLSCTINGVSSVPGTSEVAKKETEALTSASCADTSNRKDAPRVTMHCMLFTRC